MILNDKQKTILESFSGYRSPIDEGSLFKGIDIQYNCTMEDAKTFSVYHR